MIELIERSHTYLVDGDELTSVTTIMKKAGWPVWADDAALERGRLVHEMIHMYFDRTLSPKQPDWLLPYHEGIVKFQAETGFEPIEWEKNVADKTHGYAGRLDVRGKMRGMHMLVIIDFKTGDVDKWAAVQTAAYAATYGAPHHRMGVSLPGDGNYRCLPFPIKTLPYHKQVFYACCAVAKFQKETMRDSRY